MATATTDKPSVQRRLFCSGRQALANVILLFLLALVACGSFATPPLEHRPAEPPAKIAIIIDDIGYHLGNGKRSLALPGDITLAVIPFTPHGKTLAAMGADQGKEIILHAPMSNASDTPMESYALRGDMDRSTFLAHLRAGLDDIPSATGLNNHMGSLLTQQRRPMQWLMDELKQRDLFFVDSRTSAQSVAWDLARDSSIPTLKRDIFLDHEKNRDFIAAQFERLLHIAKTQGSAVGIGHPYPETLAYLESELPHLKARGLALVPVSTLMKKIKKAPIFIENHRDGYDIDPLIVHDSYLNRWK